MNLKGQVMLGFEAIRREQVARDAEKIPSGMIGRRFRRLPAGLEVQAGDLNPLGSIPDARQSFVEVADDFKEAVLDVVALGCVTRELSSDPEVRRRSFRFRYQ